MVVVQEAKLLGSSLEKIPHERNCCLFLGHSQYIPSHKGDKCLQLPFYWVKKRLLHSMQVQECISDPELKHPKGSNHLGLIDTG